MIDWRTVEAALGRTTTGRERTAVAIYHASWREGVDPRTAMTPEAYRLAQHILDAYSRVGQAKTKED